MTADHPTVPAQSGPPRCTLQRPVLLPFLYNRIQYKKSLHLKRTDLLLSSPLHTRRTHLYMHLHLSHLRSHTPPNKETIPGHRFAHGVDGTKTYRQKTRTRRTTARTH